MPITRGSDEFLRRHGLMPTLMSPSPRLAPRDNPLYARPVTQDQLIPEARKYGEVTETPDFVDEE